MRQIFRQFLRAPARIITSVFALTLAIGAIGVLAIPSVSTSSLRDSAERGGIPQIIFFTSDTGETDVSATLSGVANVDRAELQVRTRLTMPDGDTIGLRGVDVDDQEISIVFVQQGRLPQAFGELVATAGTADLGTVFQTALADGTTAEMTVVGIGDGTFSNGPGRMFSNLDTAAAVDGIEGANRVVIRANDKGKDALRATATEVRTVLADADVVSRTVPFTIPDGRHPVEADIEQISSLIGILGVVAGLVALVLLGSTTNTLITERTREVAVMRALGAPDREMRRRLRRLAMAIAGASVVLGVPLGVLISNLIARLVMDEFVGLTPGFAVSIPVMVGSALFALIGARLVAASAARRVTRRPLAEALRDRDGSPFGQRFTERFVARFSMGSLLDRAAWRNGIHRRSRSLAMLAQITTAVAALLTIASLATTVTDYNEALHEPIKWSTRTFVPGVGLDIDTSIADGDPRSEIGTNVGAEVNGWDVDIFGFVQDTQMVDRTMNSGRWFEAPGEVAISTGFAERNGIGLGDDVEVEIASGLHTYTVVGLHPDRNRAIFIDVEEFAIAVNQPGMGNVLLSLDEVPQTTIAGPTDVEYYADVVNDDEGTTAILLIFTAIGAVVVSVAGLAVASGLAVNVFERRHEFAALRAMGARRRHVFRVVVAELLPLAAAGMVLGMIGGYFGAAAIMNSFEASNAVELGFVFATGAIPVATAIVVGGSLLIGGLMVRRVTRQPAAVTLRSAA